MGSTDAYFVFIVATALRHQPAGGAEVPPEGAHIFAMTFMDMALDQNDFSFTQILASTTNKSTLRVKVPFASKSQYSIVKWSDQPLTYYNFTDSQIRFALDPNEDVIKNKAAIVVTKDTVGVFGSHAMAGSGEAYLALPITRAPHSFYLASYPSLDQVGYSLYAIAAAADTCVSVHRVVNGTYRLHKSLAMRAGDVYQEYSRIAGEDFTGLNVQSSQGVAVLAGHECAQVPANVRFCDHLLEQMPPVHEWGGEMVVPGIPDRNPEAGYTIRIVAAEPTNVACQYRNTDVLIDGEYGCDCRGNGSEEVDFRQCTQPCTTDKGGFIQMKVTDASQPVFVECTPRCLVVQYGHSRQSATYENQDPDPFMTVVTPTSHYVNEMSYVTPGYLDPGSRRLVDFVNYLAVVVPNSHRDGLRYDGRPLEGDGEHTSGAYTVVRKLNVTYGQHKISHVDPDVRVGAFAYGSTPKSSATRTAARSSYGFPVSYRIDGEGVKGDWATELRVQPGDEVITAPPAVCAQTEVSSVHETFTLSTERRLESCKLADIPESQLDAVRRRLNQAICEKIMCPDVPDNVFVSHLRSSKDAEGYGLDVRMTTTMDTPISVLVQCKADIASYLTYWDHWTSVLSPEFSMSCRPAIQSLQYRKTVYACYRGDI